MKTTDYAMIFTFPIVLGFLAVVSFFSGTSIPIPLEAINMNSDLIELITKRFETLAIGLGVLAVFQLIGAFYLANRIQSISDGKK